MVLGEINPKETHFGVDLVRCRSNALRQPGYAWSVFSVYDNIVPSTDGVLCEWSYVDLEVTIRVCDQMRYFPYIRKGWYHRCLVSYLFDKGKVRWSHIKYSLQPDPVAREHL